MPIRDVIVEGRHRKHLTNIPTLADSIGEVGLINAIVVRPSGKLIAGERRLRACESLGWVEIPVFVAASLDDARRALMAERDENECREDMRPSEKADLGRELEKMERPAAADRMTLGKISTGSATGKTRDIVGEAVGLSGRTYERAKAVVVAAETGNAVAVQALDDMDRTGKVTPAYEKVKAAEGKRGLGRPKTNPGPRILDNITDKLETLAFTLGEVDLATTPANATPEQVERWIDVLRAGRKAITQTINALEGGPHA